MNRLHLFASLILCSLVLTACSKDPAADPNGIPENAIMLSTEGYIDSSGEKTSVSGYTVEWVGDGEVVRLNEYTPSVEVSGDQAFVQGVTLSGTVYGYYPSTIVADDGWETTTPIVNIPSSYSCSMSGNRQIIALPMAAYTSSTTDEISFKHLTAAVNIIVWNATSEDLCVDRVVVTAAGHRLHGDISINFEDVNYGIAASYDDPVNESDSSVSITFPSSGEGSLIIQPGENNTKSIQVPILPVDNDRDITIQIYTHVNGASWHKYIFNHHASLPTNLTRNKMLTARCKIHTGTGNHVIENKFSVNSTGKMVFFSPGNIQYIGNADYWQFAEHQYDVIFAQTTQARPSTDINRDLFGWGTWDTPNKIDKNANNYSWTYDWGHNPIRNGGNIADQWYTLSGNAWDTILNRRTTTVSGLPNSIDNIRFTLAKISGKRGMIVFPNDYIHPKGTGFTAGSYNSYSNYTSTVSLEGWALMEAGGAIFLPVTGIRKWNSNNEIILSEEYSGYYWSSTPQSTDQAYCVYFSSSSFSAKTSKTRNLGMSVRLVRNAN